MATFQLALHALCLADNGAGLADLVPLFLDENLLEHARFSPSSARQAAAKIRAHADVVANFTADAVSAKDLERAAKLADHRLAYLKAADSFVRHTRSLAEQIAAEG